ncbi:TIGR03752 family integrating conjugative element protein [Pantoea anthophila]|uniref:TIGR03752 family integrating conjugative element protein n=1 Tax=Pantoea anthophila TaxID=470931 RepID=A0ABY2Z5Y4_9GAMM|nr:TIGR03752 family integrating conjugative element protein [Pantoea anthophila]TPV23708.1 TIGR03752 family integrating conjugative element protein [Pantoea anthophila]
MKIKSNGLVKVLVPAILVGGGFIAVKSHNSKPAEPAAQTTAQTNEAQKNLTPQELKALGIEGDTPQDTLKTIVGSLNAIRQQQDALNKQNDLLLKENAKLRERNQNVSGQVNEAVQNVQKGYSQREKQLREQQNTLTAKLNELTGQLKNTGKDLADKATGENGDIPLGLGLDGMGAGAGSAPAAGSDGLMWVSPQDGQSSTSSKNGGGSTGTDNGNPAFPTSFLGENALTKQKASYEQQVKGSTSEKEAEEEAEPVYTLPENSTLIGSRSMTALLGRVPINGTVTDPYPFKVLIGKDNLTANGIELPDVEGAIVSGTASGDWTLSCVRGQVNSITFVFTDGTVRTLPKPDRSGKESNNSNQNSGKETGTSGGIGWISDDNGIPCIAGTRKSNASTYLPTIFGLSAAGAAGDALSQGQYTTQNNVNGISATMTGDAGQAALGKALSGGMSETTDWIKQRYGQTFDAIYVQPGAKLAVHITRELAIDYEDKGRRVRYDFTMPGEDGSTGGLD